MGRVKATHIAEIVCRLEKTKSKKEKITLAAEIKGDDIAMELVYHALNPYWTYGVLPKEVHAIQNAQAAKRIDSALTTQWPQIREMLNKLMDRELTGNAAREAAESWGDVLPMVQRILKKDLRCGAHISTFNTMMGEKWIPVFEVALADEGFVVIDGKIVQRANIEYPIWAEPKYNGIRTITLYDVAEETVSLFSRKGKEFENFPNIKGVVTSRCKEFGNMMLDGEVFGDTFDDVTEVAHTKKGKDDSKLMYRVWDCMRIQEFRDGYCARPLIERQKMLTEIMSNCDPRIQQAPGCMIESEEHLLKVFTQLRSDGYEGLVLKPLDALYAFKRSKTWVKVKEMFTDEFKVIGFNPGKGKYAKTLGALVVDVAGVEVEVGSGFTDAQRDDVWKNKKWYKSILVEVKFGEKTKDGSLLWPTFLRWRQDKE